ncbi:MAG: hypothetical protein IID08_03255 [Candidatus Hydrogenedentes bacterium]|nr:hypothetical protein [Candidatus Hydrogenedentota bacterium]
MNAIEIASFAAAIASLVLAVTAILLSVFFYRMTAQLSESTKEAAKDIGSGVNRLEKLFDKLYADTFSIMKDTVTDMRKHIWPETSGSENKVVQEAEQIADDKVKALKNNLDKELSDLLKRQQVADETMSSMRLELKSVMDRVISESRQLENEAREETIRTHILRTIQTIKRPIAENIVEVLSDVFSGRPVLKEMIRMKEDGLIDYDDGHIGPDTLMVLIKNS